VRIKDLSTTADVAGLFSAKSNTWEYTTAMLSSKFDTNVLQTHRLSRRSASYIIKIRHSSRKFPSINEEDDMPEENEQERQSEQEQTLLDINTATAEELTRLTGIGPQLAQRIVAYREERGPFILPEEIVSINGIGPNTYEQFAGDISAKIPKTLPDEEKEATAGLTSPPADEEREPELPPVAKPHPTVEPQPQPTPQPTPQPEPQPEPQPVPETVPPETAPPEPPPEPPEPPSQPQQPGRWSWLAWGLAILGGGFLGMIFALLVFAGINGSLDIAHSPAMIDAQTQLDGLEERVTTLQGDVEGLRTRISSLEGLTTRMDAVEDDVATMGEDVSTLTSEVEALQENVQALSAEMDAVDEQLTTFDTFFSGLRALLTETFGEETPTPTPRPTPTAEPDES
jgi:competence ComEA-like helix-hairpin-helix protein